MQAIVIRKAGGPEALEVVDRKPPNPGPGQVLLHSLAIGINYGDILVQRGVYPTASGFPYTPGVELVGEVIAVGAGVEGLSPGTRVAAITQGGAYAEQVVVDAAYTLPAPGGLGAEELTAVLIQGLTAWGLLDAARMNPGESVLVHAAAGGVGDLLVQLARLRGASTVIGATSREAKFDRIKASGADVAVDYSAEGWSKTVVEHTREKRGVDVVFDAVGGEIRNAGLTTLAPLGRAILYGTASGDFAGLTGEQLTSVLMGSRSLSGFVLHAHMMRNPSFIGEAWATLTEGLADGRIRVAYRSYPLAEASSAQAALQRRETVGKLLLVP